MNREEPLAKKAKLKCTFPELRLRFAKEMLLEFSQHVECEKLNAYGRKLDPCNPSHPMLAEGQVIATAKWWVRNYCLTEMTERTDLWLGVANSRFTPNEECILLHVIYILHFFILDSSFLILHSSFSILYPPFFILHSKKFAIPFVFLIFVVNLHINQCFSI